MEGAGGLEGEGRGAASYPRGGQKVFPGSMAGMGMGDRVEQSGSTLACVQREVRDQTNQNGLLHVSVWNPVWEWDSSGRSQR